MNEILALPAVGAIIEKEELGTKYLLLIRRQKEEGGAADGLIAVMGGEIREDENIYAALRRIIRVKTGLRVTKIYGENDGQEIVLNGTRLFSFQPFSTVQNLSGSCSLIVHIFICQAEGEPAAMAEGPAADIRWETLEAVKKMLEEEPDRISPLTLIPLRKYIAVSGEDEKDKFPS